MLISKGIVKVMYQTALYRTLAAGAAIALFAPAVAQQQLNIQGQVIDHTTGEPLIGATVAAKGTKTGGVITDFDGRFAIKTKAELPVTLNVTFIGYDSQEVEVYDDSEPVVVTLTENRNSLQEVVVVGYGTQKRKELTGSVSSVKPQEVGVTPTSFDSYLGGQVAGLNVTANSGQPGAGSSIRIRGGNSISGGNEPLYVIDGVLLYNSSDATSTGVSYTESDFNPLATINPADIESIEVLKDVSASAIYGSRGANGVIIVTTKNGKKGKVNISYGYSAGISKVSKTLDLLNAREWGELYLELSTSGQQSATGTTASAVSSWGEGTDWQDAAFQTAVTQNHQLSVSGGSDKERFLISANYSDQQGVILGSGFTRYGARINYDRDLWKNVTLGINVNASKSVQNGVYSFGAYSNGMSGLLEQALRTSPAVSIYNEDGSYNYHNPYETGDFIKGDGQTVNAIADLSTTQAENKVDNLLGTANLKWEIIKGLTLKLQGSTNIINTVQNFFAPSSTTAGFSTNGYGSVGNKRWESNQGELTLNYQTSWNDIHALEVLAGYTNQVTFSERSVASSANFANENLGYYSLQSGSTLLQPETEAIRSVLRSFIGRVNYSLYDRYHLTATFRADGSSRFAKNNKWGYFPSVGLSWNLDEEQFLKSAYWINEFKLRASVGTVGNQEIGDYQFASSYASAIGKYYFGGQLNTGYYKSALQNDDLKWETTTSTNVGADLSLFHNKLTVNADWYYKKTSDLLLTIPVEQTTGFTSKLSNIGNVKNQGIELGIGYYPIQNKRWTWNVKANIAHNKNEVTNIGTQSEIINSSSQTIIRVGEALGTYYGWQFDGVVQKGDDLQKVAAPSNKTKVEYGDAKFVDINGDGAVDQNSDRVVLGSVQPDFTYGFSTNLRYRTWTLSLAFQGSQGNELYNALRQSLETPNSAYNGSKKLLDRWSESNPSNTVPKAYAGSLYSLYLDSRYIEDASYLRLKNLTVNYQLPVKIKQAPSLKFNVYFSATNLLTLTGYEGYDPEYSGYVDRGTYPNSRTFTLGFNINY